MGSGWVPGGGNGLGERRLGVERSLWLSLGVVKTFGLSSTLVRMAVRPSI